MPDSKLKGPRIFAEFNDPGSVHFQLKFSQDPAPTEYQLEIVGRELIEAAQMMRIKRLDAQLPVEVVKEGVPVR